MQVAFLPSTSAAPLPGAATPVPTQPEPGADDASFAALLDSNAGQDAGDAGGPAPMGKNRATPAGDSPAVETDIADLGLLVGLFPPVPMVPPRPTPLSADAIAGAPVDANVAEPAAVTTEAATDGSPAATESRPTESEPPLARELSTNAETREIAVSAQSPATNGAPGGTSMPKSAATSLFSAPSEGDRALTEAQPGSPFAPETVSVMSGDSASNVPAGPVSATRTLAQVLCETTRLPGGTAVASSTLSSTNIATPSAQTGAMPGTSDAVGSPAAVEGADLMERHGGSATTTAPVAPTSRSAVETTTATARDASVPTAVAARAVAGAADVAPQVETPAGAAPVAKPSGLNRPVPESPAEGGAAAGGSTAPRVSQENPAARRVHRVPDGAIDAGRNGSRNFQNVGRQVVGEHGARLGTDVANEAQPMPANATDLPPATHALSSDEPVIATVGAVAEPSVVGTTRAVADSGPARSVAAETIRQLQEVAARARETGRNQVDFQVRTSDDESLRVNLRWHDGVVHARFVSESAELQQALSREWALAAPRLAEKGLKFDQPSFEHHDRSGHQSAAQDGFSFAHQRQSSRGQERTFELAGTSGRGSTASLASARSTNSHGSGTQPQDRSMSAPRPAAGVSNLRAWA